MADKTSPSQENPQDSESDDEEVVETSPCGRWEKHRKEVNFGLFLGPAAFISFPFNILSHGGQKAHQRS